MGWIDFRDIPLASAGTSNLFLDYIYDFEKVAQFYAADFRSDDALDAMIQNVTGRNIERQTVAEVLYEQNKAYGCGEKTLSNIELLRQESTFAVVTGQQVGLFAGPMYTLQKAITAAKLAEELSVRYPDYSFVPVFWLEGEDHDFEEANNIHLIARDNKLIKIEYLVDGKSADHNLGATGEVVIGPNIETLYGQVNEMLPGTEFKDELLDLVKSFYKAGVTFTEAFARFLNFFFEDAGLVFINSNHPRFKHLLASVFQKEITEYARISELLVSKSAELEVDYHAQVKVKPINLFMFYRGGRYLVEPTEDGFSLRGTRFKCLKDEFMKMLMDTPEQFSPNVILRPICQDTLLPTIVYVGGPSEIAYFAQLKPVYDYHQLPMPIVYPRASSTILEAKLAKVLEKYQLQIKDFFVDFEIVSRKVAEKLSEVKIEDVFNRMWVKFDEMTSELQESINLLDPTLLGAWATCRAKIAYQMNHLKEKMISAQKRKNEIAISQIDKVAANIYPDQMLQERQLNALYFMNKYGLDFVGWLRSEIRIDSFGHQVINL